MNICLVSQEYPPETPWGGIGTQTYYKAHALVRRGHNVHVLTRSLEKGPEVTTTTADGVTVHRMLPPGYDFTFFNRVTYMMGYAWYVLKHLNALMEQTTFDVIDFPEFGGESLAYQLDRTCWNWVPVVIHLHGSLAMFTEHAGWPERGSRFHAYGTFAEQLAIQHADGLIAGSAGHADLVAGVYNADRSTIDIVHCGVDADLFTPDASVIPGPRPTVIFVGNIIENKGVHIVVEAILRLKEKYPAILLQIIGKVPEGSDLMTQLTTKIEIAAAAEHFDFVGFVPLPELPAYYRRAHVFCSPADFEGGTASVYLEAMACGCPVIASTAGGGPETVDDGVTGWLVPPSNVDATLAAIDTALADPANTRRMGVAARQRIDDYFAMDRFGARVEAAYVKIIAKSQASPLRNEDYRE
ncbi:glycogen synthase [soil metagenome]